MRKKFKILNFSKMALMILIKFCGFIVHSKPNIMTISAFPGKIHETDQSLSNSMYGLALQIYLAGIYVFDLPLKLRVVHIRKKFKISIVSKMAPMNLIKFCGR